ncbi:hypothetical protein MTP03_06560 [Tsukamurella sp. PLM1]|nr:hypothetical protein MTP03_06560 [Tsukamurella sp. PLM1]
MPLPRIGLFDEAVLDVLSGQLQQQGDPVFAFELYRAGAQAADRTPAVRARSEPHAGVVLVGSGDDAGDDVRLVVPLQIADEAGAHVFTRATHRGGPEERGQVLGVNEGPLLEVDALMVKRTVYRESATA